MKLKYCFLALLCLYITNTKAQNGLLPGDQLPPAVINNLLANNSQNSNGAAPGNYILLDFWATWCSPCVKSIHKLNGLQQQFKDQLSIIPVTFQDDDEIGILFNHLPDSLRWSMPYLADDTILHNLFPHTELPHYIWINNQGTVTNITSGDAVTEANINRFISNTPINAIEKQDGLHEALKTIPLFMSNNGGYPLALRSYTVCTGYQPGLFSVSTSEPLADTGLCRLTAINVSFPDLYRLAFATTGELSAANRMMLLVKDTASFICNNDNNMAQWMQQHTYCYEKILPKSQRDQLQPGAQQDLARLFPQYSASVEKQKVKCLVLTASAETANRIRATPVKTTYKHTGYSIAITNGKLLGFTNLLSVIYLQGLPTPVINGTGIDGPVSFHIECNLSDPSAINIALRPLGMQLIEQEREIDMIVIRDR